MDTFWPHTLWYLCILFKRLLNPMLTQVLIFLCFRKAWYIRNILWKPNVLKTAVNSKEIKSPIYFLNLLKSSCWNKQFTNPKISLLLFILSSLLLSFLHSNIVSKQWQYLKQYWFQSYFLRFRGPYACNQNSIF